MKQTKLPGLALIAEDQWGMVSTAQAAAAGVSPQALSQLAARGVLDRLTHGVYRLVGVPPDPRDELRAAWIALDPRRTAADRIAAAPTEVVSHHSAAALHGIGDLVPDRLEFTAAVRRQTRRHDIRIHRANLGSHDWTLVDGLPVTTALRTITDLAKGHLDRGHLAGVVRDALVRLLTSPSDVSAALTPYAPHYGVLTGGGDQLLDVLLEEAGVPQSTVDVAQRAGFVVREEDNGLDRGGLR
jgi:putative AbiEi antitoxin of type IV toxin-antitoxin system